MKTLIALVLTMFIGSASAGVVMSEPDLPVKKSWPEEPEMEEGECGM